MLWNAGKLTRGILGGTVLALAASDVRAMIDMPQREHVQSMVWILEALTVVVIMAVFGFVWWIGKRAQARKNTERKAPPQ